MSISKADRDYWINFLEQQLTKRIDSSTPFGKDWARYEFLEHDLKGIREEMDAILDKYEPRHRSQRQIRRRFANAVATREKELVAKSGLSFVALEERRETIRPQLMLVNTTNQMANKVRELMDEFRMSDMLNKTLAKQEGDL